MGGTAASHSSRWADWLGEEGSGARPWPAPEPSVQRPIPANEQGYGKGSPR